MNQPQKGVETEMPKCFGDPTCKPSFHTAAWVQSLAAPCLHLRCHLLSPTCRNAQEKTNVAGVQEVLDAAAAAANAAARRTAHTDTTQKAVTSLDADTCHAGTGLVLCLHLYLRLISFLFGFPRNIILGQQPTSLQQQLTG